MRGFEDSLHGGLPSGLSSPLKGDVVGLQDGQMFVVKMMHSKSMTDKAKEEVCMLWPWLSFLNCLECAEDSLSVLL